jgi:membrane-bound metal-dependent hydrolase YbcI (DUF457 family)
MPLPLGHTAIGLTTYDLCSKNDSALSRWEIAVFVTVLANLPDIDIVIGLLVQGNGNAFHRGLTHSFLFALFTGFIASYAWKFCPKIPKINFRNCFLLVLSHVMADSFFTEYPISFFWPLEVNWAAGYSGWVEIINSAFLTPLHDEKIVILCAIVTILNRSIRRYSDNIRLLFMKIF